MKQKISKREENRIKKRKMEALCTKMDKAKNKLHKYCIKNSGCLV